MGLLLTSRSLIGVRRPPAPSTEHELVLHLDGVSCRCCGRRAELELSRIDGVRSARVAAGRKVALITIDLAVTSERAVVLAMDRAGYRVWPEGAPQPGARTRERARLALTVALFAALLGIWIAADGAPRPSLAWIRLALAGAALALGFGPVLRGLRHAARHGALFREPAVLVGALIAFGVSALPLWFRSHPVPGLMAMLGWTQDAASLPGFEAAAGMMALLTITRAAFAGVYLAALERIEHGSARACRRLDRRGGARPVRADELAVGDRIEVAEGQTLPAETRLDAPARVAPPDARDASVLLAAGEVAPTGSLVLSSTIVGRIVALPDRAVRGACDHEARRVLIRLGDETASGSVDWAAVAAKALAVATVALAAFAVIAHGTLGAGPASAAAWMAASAVLASASSAAFVLGAPAARAIAVAAARAAGVVIKDPRALDRLAAADVACFDNTGTVTSGELEVVGLSWVGEPDRSTLEHVLALERNASSPAGRAIASYLEARGIAPSPLQREHDVTESAFGIAGRVHERLVEVGSARRLGIAPSADAPGTASTAWFAENGVPLGYFELEGRVRTCAREALRALAARGVACRVLAGDRAETTAAIARQLGVPAQGNRSPAEKALAVRDLQHAGARVVFIGDGWNEGAGTAQADVAVAIAPGVLPGQVAAPIVITDPSIAALPWLVDLARRVRARLRWATALSVVCGAALLPAAVLGLVSPLAAVGAAMAETMLVLVACTLGVVPERRRERATAPSTRPESLIGSLARASLPPG